MNVFDFIRQEEASYKTTGVPVADGYDFHMYQHVRKSTLYRDSKFTEGANDGSRPFKNIIRRIVNFQHFATGFDVKDIEPFVNDSDHYYKSLLVRKYHPKWARRHNLDTFIDQMVESFVDFGLVLIKHTNKVAPEVVPLQSIAFCDQTDILSGPICIKHQYSPAQLKEFEGKWQNLDEVITLARKEKTNPSGVSANTPGKFIEVYELDGAFPQAWLKNGDTTDEEETSYSQQLHIITFYKDEKGDLQGIPLFQGKGDPEKYKAIKRDPIFGRACGFGAIEEITPAQIWTNYDEIRIQGMLDAVSKVLGVTDDAKFANQKFTDLENGEWLTLAEGKKAAILDNRAVNMPLFENASTRWEEHAQGLSSSNDAVLGEAPTAGTPFKLQELVTYQGKGPHEYRKGQVATFLGEIYRDWELKDLVEEMTDEQHFMEELSLDELEYVANCLVEHETYKLKKGLILSGQQVNDQAVETFKTAVREQFMKGGTKRFFSTLKDELKSLPMDVEMNIAGKQKNLAGMADKLTNVFRTIFANPAGFVQTMQIPGAASSFNDLLEASGMSPFRFGALSKDAMKQLTQSSGKATVPQEQPAKQPLSVAA